MEKPIRVMVLGREYALRVRPEDETVTRDIAAYVDGKLQAFCDTHPDQAELTAAVVTSLAITAELYEAWEEQDRMRKALEREVADLTAKLDAALGEEAAV